ncbi:MAG: hypothetical protein NZZ41_03670 [Candidatus Dojkabacteria bacterium]|nr:hypothetical protein [Candidatus Dojkabacteria bacterium]
MDSIFISIFIISTYFLLFKVSYSSQNDKQDIVTYLQNKSSDTYFIYFIVFLGIIIAISYFLFTFFFKLNTFILVSIYWILLYLFYKYFRKKFIIFDIIKIWKDYLYDFRNIKLADASFMLLLVNYFINSENVKKTEIKELKTLIKKYYYDDQVVSIVLDKYLDDLSKIYKYIFYF